MSAEMKRRSGLRERKKAKTMAAVQKHAMRLFREFGYNATTVEQIADAAEISPSTFYRYFSTKEDVVINDNYDTLVIEAFESQPPELSLLAAVRNAMLSGMEEISAEEMDTLRERNQLIMSVPGLRAASLNNMIQMMQLLQEKVAKRTGRQIDDPAVRVFAGTLVGVNISVTLYHAEHPQMNFVKLLDEAFSKLHEGLTL